MHKVFYFFCTIFLFGFNVIGFNQTSATSFKLPKYEKAVLKNGLTIYLMEQHEVPMINVSAIMPAGAIYDNLQQSGIAGMTASSLMLGTKNMSKSKLEEELDFVGASLNTYASKESAGLNAKFASKDKDKVLGIIRDVLLSPVFDSLEFEKKKLLLLSQLERAKESPRSVISDYLTRLYMATMYMLIQPVAKIQR